MTTSPLVTTFAADQANEETAIAKSLLGTLVQPSQYVGEVISLGYTEALVQIHDFYRKKVGGIPPLAFLVASRVDPAVPIRFEEEDASVILLRVMDAAPLHNEQEAIRTRGETAQRVSGEPSKHWDSPEVMDATTAHILSFAGISCRVLGTFYLDRGPKSLVLKFGSDISNYYPNRGLKVFKPNGEALERIVNFRPPDAPSGSTVRVGTVRYASTHRRFQGIDNVPIEIIPENLLNQKTAVFGITRIGKSNTTKIILKATFELRFRKTDPKRIGQIVFDVNGEYANENVQDKDSTGKNSAIKNVWRTNPAGKADDVVTYGTTQHPNDPNRRLMLIDFYRDEHLQTGKEIINEALSGATTIYVTNFIQVVMQPPVDAQEFGGGKTRYDRRVLAYRALLAAAGFPRSPQLGKPKTKGLFGEDLIHALADSDANSKSDRKDDYAVAAQLLKSETLTWEALATALGHLQTFIHDKQGAYPAFNLKYMAEREKSKKTPEPWCDAELDKVLGMFAYPNGPKLIGRALPLHTNSTTDDYAKSIYDDLAAGRLVIVDQSGGDESINRSSADRIMEEIFRRNFADFRSGKQPPHVLVFVEEAHNLLPAGKDIDMSNIWVRTAKEGAKSRIGLVYATQEVSSIQKNILANTTNWFVGHLNNADEMRELRKYHDFDDFADSILRAQDIGFVRVKTQSNPYIVPTQIQRFEVEGV
jgi:hypothetical protein